MIFDEVTDENNLVPSLWLTVYINTPWAIKKEPIYFERCAAVANEIDDDNCDDVGDIVDDFRKFQPS